jgi:hypothetical protein
MEASIVYSEAMSAALDQASASVRGMADALKNLIGVFNRFASSRAGV